MVYQGIKFVRHVQLNAYDIIHRKITHRRCHNRFIISQRYFVSVLSEYRNLSRALVSFFQSLKNLHAHSDVRAPTIYTYLRCTCTMFECTRYTIWSVIKALIQTRTTHVIHKYVRPLPPARYHFAARHRRSKFPALSRDHR